MDCSRVQVIGLSRGWIVGLVLRAGRQRSKPCGQQANFQPMGMEQEVFHHVHFFCSVRKSTLEARL
jgi:hypothetical protein